MDWHIIARTPDGQEVSLGQYATSADAYEPMVQFARLQMHRDPADKPYTSFRIVDRPSR